MNTKVKDRSCLLNQGITCKSILNKTVGNMKNIHTIQLILGFCIFSTQAIGQVLKRAQPNVPLKKAADNNKAKKHASFAKSGGGELEVYWSEDFSNGLEGQGENGVWENEAPYGGLWFQTFPVDAPNGYDPSTGLTNGTAGYLDHVPLYFSGDADDVVTSETNLNGVMMLDADRFNSTADSSSLTTGSAGYFTTDTAVVSSLTSPSIDPQE
jgi:hypothetical protein